MAKGYNPLTGAISDYVDSDVAAAQANVAQSAADVEDAKRVAADVAAETGGTVNKDTGFITPGPAPKVVGTYTNPTTGDVIEKYDNGTEKIIQKGTLQADAAAAAAATAAEKTRVGQSAYDLLYNQFKQYGLESLVEPLKGLIVSGPSSAELTMALRETDAYKTRFAANKERIAQGLTALDEASYIEKEDAYQNLMRQYGLPASYYTKDTLGRQAGFEKLLANDVSAVELENRLQQAADILDKSPKEYLQTLQTWYPEIAKSDLMAYVLDPKNAISAITAKVNAAKIGGEYKLGNVNISSERADELRRAGVTAEQAKQGVAAIKENLPQGQMLADIYKLGPYGQTDIEAEAYGLAGASEAKKKRQKIGELETASFSGKSGATALDRGRAGAY